MISSLLSYPGGKGKALPYLLDKMPDGIEDWREPFLGGASVSLGFLQSGKSVNCKRFVVGELYPEVYYFWKAVQDTPDEVISKVYEYMEKFCPTHLSDVRYMNAVDEAEYNALYEKECAEGREFWKWARDVDCEKLKPHERAARFYIVNRTSFSGTGDSGSMTNDSFTGFNVALIEKAREVSRLLSRVEILNASWEYTIANADSEKTFIFFDAPYYHQAATPMYGRNGSTHKGFNHEKLAQACKELKCKWLMTYDDSVAIRKMYSSNGIYISPFSLQYTMAGNGGKGTDALAGEELLISNYYCECGSDEVEGDDW